MKLLLLLALLPLAASAASGPHRSLRDPFETVVIPRELVVVEGYHPPETSKSTEWSFEKLADTLARFQIKSVPALLARLPGEMLDDNFLVMYRSRSLQAATMESPRIISFSPSGQFVVTFNGGGSGRRGGDSIEVMQFREKSASFEFREIIFHDQREPEISAANPAKCLSCHQAASRSGVDPRPNWEPYRIWPGALGSFDGQITNRIQTILDGFKEHVTLPGDQKIAEDTAAEPSLLQNFLRIAEKHPRYRFLKGLNTRAPLSFTELMAGLNLRRTVRLLKNESRLFEPLRAVWNWLAYCDIKDGIPFQGQHPELENLLADREIYYPRPAEVEPDLTEEQRKSLPPDYFRPERLLSLDFTTRYLESFGVDTSDWSMDLATGGRFGASSRFSTTTNINGMFSRLLRGFLSDNQAPACTPALKAAADTQLSRTLTDPTILSLRKHPGDEFTTTQVLQNTLAKCLRCHDGSDDVAPEIPFSDPRVFKTKLNKRAKSGRTYLEEIRYRTGDLVEFENQMPPSVKLNPAEVKALSGYLSSLAP